MEEAQGRLNNAVSAAFAAVDVIERWENYEVMLHWRTTIATGVNRVVLPAVPFDEMIESCQYGVRRDTATLRQASLRHKSATVSTDVCSHTNLCKTNDTRSSHPPY